ncbi:MAG TPA: DMT family transporter [Chthoniobacterales bacterium]|nr:DMT family transporter [Chthoniobacterales bacterium]
MRIVLMLFAVFAGALQPIQAALNSQLAQRGATILWAAAISAGVTSLTLAASALLIWRLPLPPPHLFTSLPPLLWTGGILGAVILGMMTVVAPRLGAATMFTCFLAGIIACSLVLDQYGALGLPQQSLTIGRAFGAGLVLVAVILMRFF